MEQIDLALRVLRESVDEVGNINVPEMSDWYRGLRMGYMHCIDLLLTIKDDFTE